MSLRLGGVYPGQSIWMISSKTGRSAVLKGKLHANNSLAIGSSS